MIKAPHPAWLKPGPLLLLLLSAPPAPASPPELSQSCRELLLEHCSGALGNLESPQVGEICVRGLNDPQTLCRQLEENRRLGAKSQASRKQISDDIVANGPPAVQINAKTGKLTVSWLNVAASVYWHGRQILQDTALWLGTPPIHLWWVFLGSWGFVGAHFLGWLGFFHRAGIGIMTALIPVHNIVVLLRGVRLPDAWALAFFVPGLNLIVYLRALVRLAKAYNRGFAFALLAFVFPFALWLLPAAGKSNRRAPEADD